MKTFQDDYRKLYRTAAIYLFETSKNQKQMTTEQLIDQYVDDYIAVGGIWDKDKDDADINDIIAPEDYDKYASNYADYMLSDYDDSLIIEWGENNNFTKDVKQRLFELIQENIAQNLRNFYEN